MKAIQSIPDKITDIQGIRLQAARWKMLGKKIVFTNGVFDIVHEGHIASLCEAASHGDVLVVGLNADESVKRLKGPERPVNNENARALLLATLIMTDRIVLFGEDTPLELIKAIMPDVLFKGGDYEVEEIAGSKEVLAHGGEVKLGKIVEGISTTAIIARIRG